LISVLRVSPVVQDDASQNLNTVARKCNDFLDLMNKEKSSATVAKRKQSVLQSTTPTQVPSNVVATEDGKKTRRGEISAEAAARGTASSDFQSKLKQKSDKVSTLLSQVVGTNILFTGLDDAESDDVIKAFEQVKFEAGANVITQGERGEDFYVVESGILIVTVCNDGFSTQCGDLVTGAGFGELALMYNTPRAATVKTATGCVLWSLCRTTFKAITNFHKQKRMDDNIRFLKKVEILSKLNDREVALIADAAERETFEANTTIIRQVFALHLLFVATYLSSDGFSFSIHTRGNLVITFTL
jgi:CRP-like cAMP-binding protein